MVSFTSVALVVVVGFAIYYYFSRKKERYPPGPTGIPLFGSLLSVGTKPHEVFDAWKHKYGPIFSVNLGPSSAIVLTDAKIIREAFSDPNFAGRPDNKVFQTISGGKHGSLNTDGDEWNEQRRFALRNLRDFGFGKSQIEEIVIEEVQMFLSWMKKESGRPISLDRKFRLAVINALWTIMAGERYDHDDPQLNDILDTGSRVFNEAISSGAIFFPKMAQLFPNVSGWAAFQNSANRLLGIHDNAVRKHEQNPADDDHPRDFIDCYRTEIKKTTDPSSGFYKELGRTKLVAMIADLFGAGSETTSQTLRWIVLYLVRHPEVQKKLHREIDEVIGHDRLPSLSDRANMRYFDAMLMEVFRISALVPLGVFHSTMADVEFHGYKIPKDTMIIGNQYSAHYDKASWGDPENFRPERFLSPDGKTILKNDSLMPFGVGKRVCLGETLARDELFLFITSIYQKFDITADPANPYPRLDAAPGFLLNAHPFMVIMNERVH